MIDRRSRLIEELDRIEPGWVVVRPVALADDDTLCVFQKTDERKEATADIPRRWFDDGEDDQIRRAIRDATARAVQV